MPRGRSRVAAGAWLKNAFHDFCQHLTNVGLTISAFLLNCWQLVQVLLFFRKEEYH